MHRFKQGKWWVLPLIIGLWIVADHYVKNVNNLQETADEDLIGEEIVDQVRIIEPSKNGDYENYGKQHQQERTSSDGKVTIATDNQSVATTTTDNVKLWWQTPYKIDGDEGHQQQQPPSFGRVRHLSLTGAKLLRESIKNLKYGESLVSDPDNEVLFSCPFCAELHYQLGDVKCEPCVCQKNVSFSQLHCGKNRVVSRDGCGCCLVCARLENEKCDKRFVCDASKGLYCVLDEENELRFGIGICKKIMSRPCVHEGNAILEGTYFRPDCKSRCKCSKGKLNCENMCLDELENPFMPEICSRPRLVNMDGECCKNWVCDTLSGRPDIPANCPPSGTEWSVCSAHCGVGRSFRMSNQNEDCVLRNMSRVCQIRTCEKYPLLAEYRRLQNGECNTITSANVRIRMLYKSCVSIERMPITQCGNCTPMTNCCLPIETDTVTMNFICVKKEDTDRSKLVVVPSVDMKGVLEIDAMVILKTHLFHVALQVMDIKKCACRPDYCVHAATENGFLPYYPPAPATDANVGGDGFYGGFLFTKTLAKEIATIAKQWQQRLPEFIKRWKLLY